MAELSRACIDERRLVPENSSREPDFERLMRTLRKLARKLLRSETGGRALQPTALVHEAYLRLAQRTIDWRDSAPFLAVATRVMRRILADHAQALTVIKPAAKRNSGTPTGGN
jgi:DNA-directed RNA polymerase specialized sigma24 family protein